MIIASHFKDVTSHVPAILRYKKKNTADTVI